MKKHFCTVFFWFMFASFVFGLKCWVYVYILCATYLVMNHICNLEFSVGIFRPYHQVRFWSPVYIWLRIFSLAVVYGKSCWSWYASPHSLLLLFHHIMYRIACFGQPDHIICYFQPFTFIQARLFLLLGQMNWLPEPFLFALRKMLSWLVWPLVHIHMLR